MNAQSINLHFLPDRSSDKMIQSAGLKQLPPEVLELLWFLFLVFELTFLNISPLSLLLGSTCAKI